MDFAELAVFGIGKPGYLRNGSDVRASVVGSNPTTAALLGFNGPLLPPASFRIQLFYATKNI